MKMVPINIRPGFRLPHNIEGVTIIAPNMLVDLTTKQRLMTLRPSLFYKGDPDWPKRVDRVEVVGEAVEPEPAAEEKPAVEEKPKGKGKKSDGSDNPA